MFATFLAVVIVGCLIGEERCQKIGLFLILLALIGIVCAECG